MAGSAQHQRQKAAKAARRKEIVAEKRKVELTSSSLAGRVRLAAGCPLSLCVMPSTLFEIGIGHIIVARELPSGLLGCGIFLVDPFCLGLKDVLFREIGQDSLQTYLDGQNDTENFTDVPPALARKLIRDAVAYAADLGLAAPKDYRAIEAIYGDADAGGCSDAFTFGKDGKPFYVPGPLDTPARIRAVTRTLQNRLGTGGWNYLIEMPPGSPGLPAGEPPELSWEPEEQ